METYYKSAVSISYKSLLVILSFFWLTTLSSCMVGFRSPRYDSRGVIIERHTTNEHYSRSDKPSRGKHQKHGKQNGQGERNE
jgi:hypothetical protein